MTVLLVLGAVVLLGSVVPLFAGIRNAGTWLGIFLGAFLLWQGLPGSLAAFGAWRPWARAVVWILECTLLGFLIWGAVGTLSADMDSAQPGRTLIVLGCRLRPDGPGTILRTRLDAAYAYLERNPGSTAVLCGGKGSEEIRPEAEGMQEYLVSRGIDPARLYREDRSRSTKENLLYAKKVIEENHLEKKAAIASSEYHLWRARMLGRKLGMDCQCVSAHTPGWMVMVFWLREVLCVIAEVLRGLFPGK